MEEPKVRETTLPVVRDGVAATLYVRYTPQVNALRAAEVEVRDLDHGIMLAYGAPPENIFQWGFGYALRNGEGYVHELSSGAGVWRWEFSAPAMQELKRWLVAVGAVEGSLPPEPRGRVSALAGDA